MAEMSEVCACGHSVYDHKGHRLGDQAERFRDQDGTDCERKGCVCLMFNSVLETSDARVWRSPAHPYYNAGIQHPLVQGLQRVKESERVFIRWHTLYCDSCFTEMEPTEATPVNDSLYCDDCVGAAMAPIMIALRERTQSNG